MPTFLITVVGWVLFRAETLAAALRYMRAMLRVPGAAQPALFPYFNHEFWGTLGLAAAIAFVAALPRAERWELNLLARSHFSVRSAAGLALATVLLLGLSMSYLLGSTFNPFIYFRV